MNKVIDLREYRQKNINFSNRRRRKLWIIVGLLEGNPTVTQRELSHNVAWSTPQAILGAINELRDCGWVIRREKTPKGDIYRLMDQQPA